jgi:hypothetical protein
MSQTMPRNVPPSVPSMSNTPDFMQRQQQPDPRFRPMASSSSNTGGSFVSLNEAAVFHIIHQINIYWTLQLIYAYYLIDATTTTTSSNGLSRLGRRKIEFTSSIKFNHWNGWKRLDDQSSQLSKTWSQSTSRWWLSSKLIAKTCSSDCKQFVCLGFITPTVSSYDSHSRHDDAAGKKQNFNFIICPFLYKRPYHRLNLWLI